MKYRSMTAAALVAVTGTIGAWSIGTASAQQGTQPTQPGQRPTTPPGQTTQPGQRPMTPPGRTTTGMGSEERLFALEGAGAERKVQQLATRLSAIERQMMQTNQQLNQKVNQLDTMQGDQKVETIGEVLQQIVQEHDQLHDYLKEIRTSLTGEAGSEGVIPGTPRPGETPSRPGESPSRPSTPPGQPPR